MEGQCPVAIDGAGSDIHGEATRIRAQGPVARITLPGGLPAWSITGYEAARQALADPRLSKDARRHWTAYAAGEIGPDFPLIHWARMENLTTADGDDHARQRRLIASAFGPRRVAVMRAHVTRIVDELLDRLAAHDDGTVVDLKDDFARPLAAEVIGDLIGVPPSERVTILRGSYDATPPGTPEEANALFTAIRGAVQNLIEAKRRRPADDLTSDLLAARAEDGARLSEAELASTVLLLLNTGTEPVMNLITNAVCALLRHPDQLDLVRGGHASWSAVVEETLRSEAPVAHLPFRFPVEHVAVADVTIPRGEPVLVHFAAAGRDPAVHPDPARFDLDRQDQRHLSFGHGAHRCVGSALALLEAEIALDALFRRFPRLKLAVPPEQVAPQGGFIMNGRRALPVRLSPAPVARPRQRAEASR
ncbi:cytochrome P450 [Micromonospora sp. NPDC050980]|uniref:cytochrome P450 family protein n=1 Tax=Micromonospora sp. NPDC050980 TaxID=3155161 RepID=UPI0033F93355